MANTPFDTDMWQQEVVGVAPLKARAKGKAIPASVPQDAFLATNHHSRRPPPVQVQATHLKPLSIGDFSDIDAATVRRLKRGRLDIHATMDLHSMKQPQAHQALEEFIFQSVTKGKKLVLVITGKGGIHSPSILRTKLPIWLNLPNIRPYIIALDHASPAHGGSGAFYVLLRKKAL